MRKAYNLIVVGAGSAGSAAVQAAHDATILLVHGESGTPYRRDELSRTLFSDSAPSPGLDPVWLQQHDIDFRNGVRATGINAVDHTLTFADGVTVGYDRLILATGSNPVFPKVVRPHERGSFFVLRTLDDARDIVRAAKKAKNVLIAGMGVLALELAQRFVGAGIHITLAGATPQLMPRQLNARSAEIIEDVLVRSNVRLLFQEEILSFDENNHHSWNVQMLKHHSQYDMVVFCVGVSAETELAKIAGLNLRRGILVDESLRTSNEHIFAAGDCAELPDGTTGFVWNQAAHQGEVAGRNATGGDSRVRSVPFPLTTSIFGQTIASIGVPRFADAFHVQETEDGSRYYALFISESRVTGGIVINDERRAGILVDAVQNSRSLEDVQNQL